MNQNDISSAFVLHTRAFKENSLIVELLTLEHGRVSVVAKGARSHSKSNRRALLQAFQPLQVSWFGRSDLKSLKQLEAGGLPFRVSGIANLSGLYLNELLLKLLIPWDPHPELFQVYQTALEQFHHAQKPQIILREFELLLIEELGYGIDWQQDIYADAIEPEQQYAFVAEQGFISEWQAPKDSLLIKGNLILAVAGHNWQVAGSLALARKVCRQIIDQLLGHKTLNSRKLLQETLKLSS